MRTRSALAATLALAVVLLLAPLPAEAKPHADAGGAVVYVSDRDSPSVDRPVDDVYLQRPDDRRVYRLTHDDGGAELYPTLSPDGRQLAFVRTQSDEAGGLDPDTTALYVCRLRYRQHTVRCGSERQVVAPVQRQAIAWTPDGRSLLYSPPFTADGDSDLYRVDLRRGATPVNLTSEPTDGVGTQNVQPSVSADGRWVYYAVGRIYSATGAPGPTGGDLYRRLLNGSGPAEQLTAAPNNDNGVDISPDGRYLVFHSNRADAGNVDIYRMRAEPEGPDNPAVNLTAGLRTATGDAPSQERRPSFSPDGGRIAFWWYTDPLGGPCVGCTDGEVYTMRFDGSDLRNLTDNNGTAEDPAPTPLHAEITPDWGVLAHRGWWR